VSDHDDEIEPDACAAYVFASGTSPGAALRARAAMRDVFGGCDLLTRREEDFHYTFHDWGFGFIELSREDPIEGPLQATLDEFDKDVAELARAPVSPFVEPFSFIIVGIAFMLGAVASGFGQRAGEDLYDVSKGRLVRRFGKPGSETEVVSTLAQIFEGLGLSYRQTSVAGGPIFLRVHGPDVTFLCEPELPAAAVRGAARLILDGDVDASLTSRPLRWSATSERWESLPADWANKKVMRKLNRALSERAKGDD
jgi:hypothetical protein